MELFGCRELIVNGGGFVFGCNGMEGNVGTSCMTWIWNNYDYHPVLCITLHFKLDSFKYIP